MVAIWGVVTTFWNFKWQQLLSQLKYSLCNQRSAHRGFWSRDSAPPPAESLLSLSALNHPTDEISETPFYSFSLYRLPLLSPLRAPARIPANNTPTVVGLVIQAPLTSSGRTCLAATVTHKTAEHRSPRQERECDTHGQSLQQQDTFM